ncbi:MAG: hypothetical protein AAF990_13125 [Bacteroidota bacterium]
MSNNQYRYPGIFPFASSQSHLFFGRDKDILNVYRLISREPLTVIYGKSGLGKSSLINAGLIPKIAEDKTHQPFIIRFGAWTEDKTETLLSTIKNLLVRAIREESVFISKLLPEDNSLWFHAKRLQVQKGESLLLIFDQFEEIFSYPKEQIVEFEQELAELLYTTLPLRYRRKIDASDATGLLTEEEEDLLEKSLVPKVLFSIRSDRLHLIDRFKDYFPSILNNCYELNALTIEDAKTAITYPARLEGDFITSPFEYSGAVIEKLLDFLSDQQEQRVEGILIQMLCDHYEKSEVEKKKLRKLELTHIGDPTKVIKNYYEQRINALSEENQLAARDLIEQGLVSEGEGMRLTLHEAFILNKYHIAKPLLEQLVDSRLLRAEPFIRGGYSYELAHDRLVPPVVSARDHRKEREAEQARKEAEIQMRKQAELDRQEKEKVNKQLRQVRVLSGFLTIALVLAGHFWWQANQKTTLAKNAEKMAIEQSKEADEQRAKAEENLHKLQLKNFKANEDRLRDIRRFNKDNPLPEGLLVEMLEISTTHPDSSRLMGRMLELKEQYNLSFQ